MGFIVPTPPIPPPSVMDSLKYRFINNKSKAILYTYKRYWWPRIIGWIIGAKPDIVDVTGCKECKHLKYNDPGWSCTYKKFNRIMMNHWEIQEGDKIYYECPIMPPKIKAIEAVGKL